MVVPLLAAVLVTGCSRPPSPGPAPDPGDPADVSVLLTEDVLSQVDLGQGRSWFSVGGAADHTPAPCGARAGEGAVDTVRATWRQRGATIQVAVHEYATTEQANRALVDLRRTVESCLVWLEDQEAFTSEPAPTSQRLGVRRTIRQEGSDQVTSWWVGSSGSTLRSVTVRAEGGSPDALAAAAALVGNAAG